MRKGRGDVFSPLLRFSWGVIFFTRTLEISLAILLFLFLECGVTYLIGKFRKNNLAFWAQEWELSTESPFQYSPIPDHPNSGKTALSMLQGPGKCPLSVSSCGFFFLSGVSSSSCGDHSYWLRAPHLWSHLTLIIFFKGPISKYSHFGG